MKTPIRSAELAWRMIAEMSRHVDSNHWPDWVDCPSEIKAALISCFESPNDSDAERLDVFRSKLIERGWESGAYSESDKKFFLATPLDIKNGAYIFWAAAMLFVKEVE